MHGCDAGADTPAIPLTPAAFAADAHEKAVAAPVREPDGIRLRRWFYPYASGLVVLVLVQQFAGLEPGVRSLILYFVYMAVAGTFCPVPTAAPVMYVATAAVLWESLGASPAWGPPVATVLGTIGTGLANLQDYHVVTFLMRARRIGAVRRKRWYARAEAWFKRAPFWTLAAASFLPIPVDAVRLLAITSRYPRVPFAIASVVGRAPRYAMLAYLAHWLHFGVQAILLVLAATVIFGISRGLPRLIRQARRKSDG